MAEQMSGRLKRQQQLAYLFARQNGKCHICGEVADLFDKGPLGAVRFRVGSSFGNPGRVRRRVMTHRKCAQERSDQIQQSVPVEELWWRSDRFPGDGYQVVKKSRDG